MDPSNVDHQRLAEMLQIATGIENRSISDRSFDTVSNAMRTCHLQVEYQEDLSKLSGRAKLPWYTSLDNALCDSRVRWPATSLEEGQFGKLTKNAAEILSMAGHLQVSLSTYLPEKPISIEVHLEVIHPNGVVRREARNLSKGFYPYICIYRQV